MLRRLEKGLNSAKLKSHSTEATSPYQEDLRISSSQDHYTSPSHSSDQPYSATNSHFAANEPPPPMQPSYQSPDGYPPSANGSRSVTLEDEKDDFDRADEPLFPAKLISENKRNSFFRDYTQSRVPPFSSPSEHLLHSTTEPYTRACRLE